MGDEDGPTAGKMTPISSLNPRLNREELVFISVHEWF